MKHEGPVTCPHCEKKVAQGKAMQHHLRDAHQVTGMAAHKIANPNDRQARESKTGRRTSPKRVMVVTRLPKHDDDIFDVLEDF